MNYISSNVCILAFFVISCQSTQGQHHEYTNALAGESSPYLLQHAHNPVNWHPWKNEALEKARKENKLMIISIGYASCHWCHVMEHESFEDTAVSRLMNEHFVNIKVDREERPDVDDVYMTACQLTSTKGCGWPLNAFALPDGRPVWVGTYFPKKNWLEILNYFIKLYQEEPEKLEEYGNKIAAGIQDNSLVPVSEKDAPALSTDLLSKTVRSLLGQIDKTRGGRLGAPKFPMPNNYEFLLEEHFYTQNDDLLHAVQVTLDNMAFGGIYDHLEGGFARYSTDENWKVPHFEKMLYDNGQLVSLYSKAYQVTKSPLYKKVVSQTLDFILQNMTSGEGGFYSSFDADSEGEEGKFYTWRKIEMDSILNNAQQATYFNEVYQVTEKGNWEAGKNILFRDPNMDLVALGERFQITPEELETALESSRQKLLNARQKREKPGLDDKILTAWNALMLKGLLDAYNAFGDQKYLEAALRNGHFLLDNMTDKDFRLNRNFKDGKSSINAFLDDYAFTIQALISLYSVTFDEKWLMQANGLASYVIQHFSDSTSALFYYTSDLDPPLIARKMDFADNVIPSSNSAMAKALYRLGLYLYNEDYQEISRKMLLSVADLMNETESPDFYSNWGILYREILHPPYEIAIVGSDFEKLRKGMMEKFLPNALFLGGKDEGSLELLEGKLQPGSTFIYVCQDKICKFPVQQVEAAFDLMK